MKLIKKAHVALGTRDRSVPNVQMDITTGMQVIFAQNVLILPLNEFSLHLF